MSPKALSDEWVEVFNGSPQLAQMLRGELEDNGIPAFTPDVNLKLLDPLDIGGNVFDVRLLVPREHAERARELVRPPDAADALPAPEDEPRDEEWARILSLARRLRWCAAIPLFAPYGLWLATSYFPAVRQRGTAPPAHKWTIAAALMCCVWLVSVAIVFPVLFSGSGWLNWFTLTRSP